MNSLILRGQTSHRRFQPRRHAFDYRMMWLCVDLDELPQLGRNIALLGHNRRAIFSLNDADYGGSRPGTIREKLEALLSQHGLVEPLGRIMLITLPRVIGYAFNPVSFFLCYRPDGCLAALVAEVRNTMGEAHHYVLQSESQAPPDGWIYFHCLKRFYVSPFLSVAGEYEVMLREQQNGLTLQIKLWQDQQPVFSAELSASGKPLTSREMIKSAVLLPWYAGSVMTRITWQAFWLALRLKLPVYAKPVPSSATTYVVGRSNFWQRLRTAVVRIASDQTSVLATTPLMTLHKDRH